MDEKPFFEFNVLDFKPHQIRELKKFTKQSFSLEDILKTANTLKYSGEVKKILKEELEEPSKEFIKFFASKIYNGKLTQKIMEQFSGIVKEARKQFIDEKIDERLDRAKSYKTSESNNLEDDENSEDLKDDIVTTEEEKEGYNIVKAILSEIVDLDRIFMRDTKSYCGILLDNNNRKPICRLRFNHSQKYIGIFSNKAEEKIKIDSLNDIFKSSNKLKSVILEYENAPSQEETNKVVSIG